MGLAALLSIKKSWGIAVTSSNTDTTGLFGTWE
jgi:hypothetical protein